MLGLFLFAIITLYIIEKSYFKEDRTYVYYKGRKITERMAQC